MLWRFQLSWQLPAYLLLAVASVPLAAIDWRFLRLPNRITRPALPITAALLFLPAALEQRWNAYPTAAAGAAVMWLLYQLVPKMGGGDRRLAPTLGMLLGWLGWLSVAAGIWCTFVLFGPAVVLLNRWRTGRREVPFAPAMLSGTMLAVLASA